MIYLFHTLRVNTYDYVLSWTKLKTFNRAEDFVSILSISQVQQDIEYK